MGTLSQVGTFWQDYGRLTVTQAKVARLTHILHYKCEAHSHLIELPLWSSLTVMLTIGWGAHSHLSNHCEVHSHLRVWGSLTLELPLWGSLTLELPLWGSLTLELPLWGSLTFWVWGSLTLELPLTHSYASYRVWGSHAACVEFGPM